MAHIDWSTYSRLWWWGDSLPIPRQYTATESILTVDSQIDLELFFRAVVWFKLDMNFCSLDGGCRGYGHNIYS